MRVLQYWDYSKPITILIFSVTIILISGGNPRSLEYTQTVGRADADLQSASP